MIAAEPKNADVCARSLAAGKQLRHEASPDTICDALKLVITDHHYQVSQKRTVDKLMFTHWWCFALGHFFIGTYTNHFTTYM